MDTPPLVIPAPKLDSWLSARRISNSQAAEKLGVSRETMRLYRLPFGDPRRMKPGEDVMERIVAWTGGEVTAADFYPPHLNGGAQRPAATEEAPS